MQTEPTIWIIDDDAAFSAGLFTLLNSLGFKSAIFTSADQFLASFDPQQPGCILLDVCMPNVDGLALQERLSQQPLSPPIIMMTSYPEVPTAVRAMQQGAIEYLPKTCQEAQLREAIGRAIAWDAKTRTSAHRHASLEVALAQLSPPGKGCAAVGVARQTEQEHCQRAECQSPRGGRPACPSDAEIGRHFGS